MACMLKTSQRLLNSSHIRFRERDGTFLQDVEQNINVSSMESCAYYCQKLPCCAAFAYTAGDHVSECQISPHPPHGLQSFSPPVDEATTTTVYETGSSRIQYMNKLYKSSHSQTPREK